MPWSVGDPGAMALSLPSLGQSLESTVVQGRPFLTARHAGKWEQQCLVHLQATVKRERKQGCFSHFHPETVSHREVELVSEQPRHWRTSLGSWASRFGGKRPLGISNKWLLGECLQHSPQRRLSLPRRGSSRAMFLRFVVRNSDLHLVQHPPRC